MAQTDTKTQILDTAEALLQDRGFNAFSYNHISQPLGVKNAAIHYHFPSKGDLGVALIERCRARFQQYTELLEAGEASPVLKFEAYLTLPWRYLRDGGKICPLGVLEVEFNTLPEEMRLEVIALDQQMRAWLAMALEEGREQELFDFDGSAEEQATVIAAALQGALQLARVAGHGAFNSCVRHLKQELGLAN